MDQTLLQGHLFSRFSGNSEALASELLENHEEILPMYYIGIMICLASSYL